MTLKILPRGSRLKVKVLSMEMKTEGGIIIPRAELGGGGEPAAEEQMAAIAKNALPTLQLADILDVGEGTWNMQTGEYNGSRYKAGQRVLFRCGPTSQVHVDLVPPTCGGKSGEMLIQESLVAAVLEGEIKDATGKLIT
jgi:co-chaperonin GroES (HSP10)